MQRQRLILISGIVLGLIAIFMIKVYIDQQRKSIHDAEVASANKYLANSTPVLVAKQDIPRGSTLDSDALEAETIPNKFVQPEAVTSLTRVEGMKTIAPIKKGEQVTLSKLSYGQSVGGLAEATPVGMRAITISVDNVASLAGMIKPRDYVDVIAMIPVPVQTSEGKQVAQLVVVPLFQNVLVLAVGQETGAAAKSGGQYSATEEKKKESASLITLALSSQQANLIAFVQEQSKIRLVLRSPADSKIEMVQPATIDTLLQYIMPPAPPRPVPVEEKKEYVEIIRGLNKEKVPLSK